MSKINIIPICSYCGKVDSVKEDGHSCLQHTAQEINLEYYD